MIAAYFLQGKGETLELLKTIVSLICLDIQGDDLKIGNCAGEQNHNFSRKAVICESCLTTAVNGSLGWNTRLMRTGSGRGACRSSRGKVCLFMCVRLSARCMGSGRVLLFFARFLQCCFLPDFQHWHRRFSVMGREGLWLHSDGHWGEIGSGWCSHFTCRYKQRHGRNYEWGK